jgi:hypothetical protein
VNEQPAGAGDSASRGSAAPTSAASILAAAEQLAAEITRNAHTEADAIRARAGSDSDAARAATRDRLRRLSTVADGILEQMRELRAELDSLSGSLDGPEAESGSPALVIPEPGHVRPVATAPEPEPAVAPESAAAPESELESAAATESGIDDAGARLIALNLALSDTPRAEAVRQLRDQVPDPERLVDEVYASVDR